MGTLVLPPEIGGECAHWPVPAETPRYIFAMFYGIERGNNPGAKQPPNGHVFRLTQVDGQPCLFVFENIAMDWRVELGIDPAQTWILLRTPEVFPDYYFYDGPFESPPDEYYLFHNDYIWPFNNWGWDGHCIIFWDDPFVLVPHDLGLDYLPDLMLEVFSDDNNEIYLKYCSLQGHVNITIKIPR